MLLSNRRESPACSASAITGTRPAHDTRLSSSNTAESGPNVWDTCTGSALSVLGTPVKAGVLGYLGCCLCSWPGFAERWIAAGVQVERPQRSEDERPGGWRGFTACCNGPGAKTDVVEVQGICRLLR